MGPRYFDKPNDRASGPDYFKDNNKPRKADWRSHEKTLSKRSGDRRVAGSGNQPGRPGDAMGTRFLREGKSTKHGSISISSKWMKKLVQEALKMGRTPLFEIRLESAVLPVPTDWVLIPAVDFAELTEAAGVRPHRPAGNHQEPQRDT